MKNVKFWRTSITYKFITLLKKIPFLTDSIFTKIIEILFILNYENSRILFCPFWFFIWENYFLIKIITTHIEPMEKKISIILSAKEEYLD